MEKSEVSEDPLQSLLDEGWVTDVLRRVKSGKEADVYLCRGGSATGHNLVAAKVYRGREHRGFSDDSVYWDGGMRQMGRRLKVAATKKSSFGREVLFGAWMGREFETLTRLAAAGARVPRPLAQVGDAILLEWIGDDDQAAPQLRQVRLDPDEAMGTFELLVAQVELFMACDVVHADLSEYNILWAGGPVVIDFPQAIDPRFNKSARTLLERDLRNLVRHFGRYGLVRDPAAITADIWHRWMRAELRL